MKLETLKDLKTWLDKLSLKNLNQKIFFCFDDLTESGTINQIKKAKENLYLPDEETSLLMTYEELLQFGLEENELGNIKIEIPKGNYYFEI